jgi:hypothetical protein
MTDLKTGCSIFINRIAVQASIPWILPTDFAEEPKKSAHCFHPSPHHLPENLAGNAGQAEIIEVLYGLVREYLVGVVGIIRQTACPPAVW